MDVDAALRVATTKLSYKKINDRDAILPFVNGKDVFVSLPTGYGKSFCYQILPVLFNAICGHQTATAIIINIIIIKIFRGMNDTHN